jgi:hypothetical protein
VATSIEERILDLVKTKLEAITTGAGFEQTVQQVTRASGPEQPMEVPANKIPALQIRHLQTACAPHLRGAIECLMEVEIICIADQDAADEKLSDLMADVVKVIQANKRWDAGGGTFLARRTWVGNPIVHETEITETPVTGSVPFSIVFRVDATNPYATKEV